MDSFDRAVLQAVAGVAAGFLLLCTIVAGLAYWHSTIPDPWLDHCRAQGGKMVRVSSRADLCVMPDGTVKGIR